MSLVANGHQIKYGELMEALVDVDRYEEPKQKKVRTGRGLYLMTEERHQLGYGATNIQMLYGALYNLYSPVRNEGSREGKRFRLDYGVPWQVFIQLCNVFQTLCRVG